MNTLEGRRVRAGASPDGSRVLVLCQRFNARWWLVNRDGSGLRELDLSRRGTQVLDALWEPVGDSLLVVRQALMPVFDDPAAVSPADASWREVATDGTLSFTGGVWSPHGRWIALRAGRRRLETEVPRRWQGICTWCGLTDRRCLGFPARAPQHVLLPVVPRRTHPRLPYWQLPQRERLLSNPKAGSVASGQQAWPGPY
jgi:hypothetical protein